MRGFGDALVRLGPAFAAIFLMLVVGVGVVLVAYSSWQLVRTRERRRHPMSRAHARRSR